ncbi:flagellar P-ring protein FlgI [Aeromonas salmonicida subsp. salmonicida]|uniref:Flagellar P-ring protein n=1 Tax=Aeromonas salmonicida subsp. salmonicida 01-B526 TaxID=1076135 RepID=A0ABP2MW77_AERSS|nr:flagellar basal body P-ring protein FlgI [Aeromonas salmonicida]AYO62686.1 flagellar basal body P-ring protein FlgI [Aeromonas salmonicida subsp. salmonicida 01-B526]EHI50612.1 flagellar basal body P-ring protein [Aeromonas salmonicida subsp. salmonicida 01-B526]EKP0239880.1 flagellar basal body P-ring protein FlgI [Aeromonas salmonicida]EKP0244063.1 flagellar basal body P-ring protein FlgI [Aeromonas salmonicida]EKP0252266.1 flagellar basal body P-ring protein FlgI [Aeromonas salmonicida]
MKSLRLVTLICCLMPLGMAHASRIKDISSVEGVRNNQLIGYGLVVGLPGTGEKNNAFTEQTFRTMLNNFGIKVPDNIKPKIKDVAPVAIHADLPPFSKPGQTIDVTVSAIGEAKSLRGGTLLQSFLKGLDGRVYAVAQGSLVVGGLGAEGADGSKVVINTPTVGRIANGATVEREVPNSFGQGDTITFNLNRPDFTTARGLADVVNDLVGPNTAQALDATSVKVYAPRDPGQRVSYLATIENLEVDPASESAKIIVNSRTGTIVIGSNVRLKPAAISHGGLTVTIAENQQVSQPNPLAGGETAVTNNSTINVQQEPGRMFKLDTGATLDDLVRAVNQVGVAPGDLMAILEALQQAGAIEGQLVIL